MGSASAERIIDMEDFDLGQGIKDNEGFRLWSRGALGVDLVKESYEVQAELKNLCTAQGEL